MPKKRLLETILGPPRKWVGCRGGFCKVLRISWKCRWQKFPVKVQKCRFLLTSPISNLWRSSIADSRCLCILLNSVLSIPHHSSKHKRFISLLSSVKTPWCWLPFNALRSTAWAGVPRRSRKGWTSAIGTSTAQLTQHSISWFVSNTQFLSFKVSYKLADLSFYHVSQDTLTGQPEVMSILTQTASCLRNFACSCFTLVSLWFEKNFVQSDVVLGYNKKKIQYACITEIFVISCLARITAFWFSFFFIYIDEEQYNFCNFYHLLRIKTNRDETECEL